MWCVADVQVVQRTRFTKNPSLASKLTFYLGLILSDEKFCHIIVVWEPAKVTAVDIWEKLS